MGKRKVKISWYAIGGGIFTLLILGLTALCSVLVLNELMPEEWVRCISKCIVLISTMITLSIMQRRIKDYKLYSAIILPVITLVVWLAMNKNADLSDLLSSMGAELAGMLGAKLCFGRRKRKRRK